MRTPTHFRNRIYMIIYADFVESISWFRSVPLVDLEPTDLGTKRSLQPGAYCEGKQIPGRHQEEILSRSPTNDPTPWCGNRTHPTHPERYRHFPYSKLHHVTTLAMTLPPGHERCDRPSVSRKRSTTPQPPAVAEVMHLGGFQLVMGVSLYRWMVFVRENPVQMDDD